MYLKEKVKNAGNWAAIYNATNDCLVAVSLLPSCEQLGRKYVLTNALTKMSRKQKKSIVPGCDEYSFLYSMCDRYNEFAGFHFPHKHGGKNSSGIYGAQHDFAITSTLKNTFNVFEDMHGSILKSNPPSSPLQKTNWTFRDHCTILSDELFRYACNM
jgi:hypothetical protein